MIAIKQKHMVGMQRKKRRCQSILPQKIIKSQRKVAREEREKRIYIKPPNTQSRSSKSLSSIITLVNV
jgi:hypothetical protein